MKITTVSYQRTYNLGSYNSEKIGLEADIEDGEDIELVFAQLKKQVADIHQFNNPRLYQEQETTIPIVDYSNFTPTSNDFSPQQPIKKLSQQELIESEIQRADTPQKLKEWELLSNKFPQTKELYQNKLNQLTNK